MQTFKNRTSNIQWDIASRQIRNAALDVGVWIFSFSRASRQEVLLLFP
jgi:hypothetical protein